MQIPHGEEGTINEVEYRLAWSRTYLKKFGLLENSSRGIWALSKSNIDTSKLDYTEIVRTVRDQNKNTQPKTKKSKITISQVENEIEEEVDNSEEWKEQLLNILYNITPWRTALRQIKATETWCRY